MQTYLLKNGSRLTLREAEPRDAEAMLIFVEQTAHESENLTRGPGEFTLSVEQERDFLAASAQAPTSLFLLAEVAGELAGNLNFSAGNRQRIRHIGDMGIAVLQKYWNLGIGGRLLTYMVDWARATATIRKIDLRVRVDNPAAIHLYEKYGFVREGRITRGFYLRGEFIDLYTMGLQIDPPALLEQ
jgi:RimJ/RimL family protein N-acetyltransferase